MDGNGAVNRTSQVHPTCKLDEDKSVTQGRCQMLGGDPTRHAICISSGCTSPWRLCTTCVEGRYGKNARAVTAPGADKCSSHTKSLDAPSSGRFDRKVDLVQEAAKEFVKPQEYAVIVLIPWSLIDPDPNQPRKKFDPETIARLAECLEKDGQETAIKVRVHPIIRGRYMINAGERRWRAYEIIAKKTGTDPLIQCVIEAAEDEDKHFLSSVIENLHREDLHVLDECAVLQRLRDKGYSVADLARMTGKSIGTIDNYLKVNGLPEKVKWLLHPDCPKEKQLSLTSAIDIARRIPEDNPEGRLKAATKIVDEQMSVADAKYMLEGHADRSGRGIGGEFRKPSDDYRVLQGFLTRTLRDAERLNGKLLIDELYEHRPDARTDRKRDGKTVEKIIKTLEALAKRLNE